MGFFQRLMGKTETNLLLDAEVQKNPPVRVIPMIIMRCSPCNKTGNCWKFAGVRAAAVTKV